MLSRSPVEPVQNTASRPKTELVKPKAPRAMPVRIYTDAEELVDRPFHNLGKASDDSYQTPNQGSLPNIPTIRRRMQINASKMKTDAVLLHSCEVTGGASGCYRWVVYIGSTLSITIK